MSFKLNCQGSKHANSSFHPTFVFQNKGKVYKISKKVKLGEDLEVNLFGFGAMRIIGTGVYRIPENKQNSIDLMRRTVEMDAKVRLICFGPMAITCFPLLPILLFHVFSVFELAYKGLGRPFPGTD